MRRLIIFTLLLAASSLLQAQDVPNELDLSTAVLQQYRKLAPETVRGFHWMSNGSFLHSDKGGKLVVRNLDGDIFNEITLKGVNSLLQNANLDSVRRLSVAETIDDQILLYGRNRLYKLSSDGEDIQLDLTYPSESANKEFHFETASMMVVVQRIHMILILKLKLPGIPRNLGYLRVLQSIVQNLVL